MKLIRLFGIIILICLIWGLGSAFNGEDYKPIDEVVEESSNEKQTISFSASEEENIANEVSTENDDTILNEEKKFDVSIKVDDNNSITSRIIIKSVDSSNVTKKQEQVIVSKAEEITQKEEVKDTKQEIVVEEQTQIIVENNVVEETQEEVKEINKEEDNELEILMKQVEYDTYEKVWILDLKKL